MNIFICDKLFCCQVINEFVKGDLSSNFKTKSFIIVVLKIIFFSKDLTLSFKINEVLNKKQLLVPTNTSIYVLLDYSTKWGFHTFFSVIQNVRNLCHTYMLLEFEQRTSQLRNNHSSTGTTHRS